MRRILLSFALTAFLITPLPADWKIVTANNGQTTTAYYKGASLRTDYSSVYVTVADFDHRKQITWRNDLRQYTVFDWRTPPPPTDPSSQPVIKIERTTTDTGERKPFFGRTARHLITRTVRDGLETQTDGWYIDAPALPAWKHGGSTAIAVLTSSVGNQKPVTPRIDLKQTGPAPEGLPVVLKTTTHGTMSGASAHTFENSSQVIELDDAPLPDQLFQPPDGYERVDQLPTANPARHTVAGYGQDQWRRMLAWINSLFTAR